MERVAEEFLSTMQRGTPATGEIRDSIKTIFAAPRDGALRFPAFSLLPHVQFEHPDYISDEAALMIDIPFL
jgi:hypothetical protein